MKYSKSLSKTFSTEKVKPHRSSGASIPTRKLSRLRREDIDFDEVLPETELADVGEAASVGLRARMDEGLLTSTDVSYLLDPIGYELPQ